MIIDNPLSDEAKALLTQLQVGDNIADPRSSIGAFAYSLHAQAFFSNAIALCNYDGMSDFRVYGALYSVRQALELMLKCIVRNEMIDNTLRLIMKPGQSFDDVCDDLYREDSKNGKKAKKTLLMHAICMLRNVLEDQIIYPDCHKKNINLDFAERALNYLRMTPDLPREQFATAWSSSAFGHVLINLWRVAAPTIEMFASDARRHAVEIGFEPPLASLELKPIIDLLGALDDGGDGFRYPSSLSGAWYVAVPSLSLEALKALVGRLQSTCTVFRLVREYRYSMATIGQPTPQYSE